MKNFLLIMVLALGMCSIKMSAQTKKQSVTKHTTTSRSTNSQQGGQIMKFRQVGEDGYVWYKLKRGNLYGVRDSEGNDIIPIKYDEVNYICKEEKGFHYFKVKEGKFEGAFTREGTMVVSPNSRYWLIELEGASSPKIDNGGMVFWIAKKENDNTAIILDARGKYVIKLPEGCIWAHLNSSFGDIKNMFSFAGINYFQIEGSGAKIGIFDLDGNQIAPPIYNMCYLQDWGNTISKELDGKKTQEKIEYKCSTKFNYTPFESLYFAFSKQSLSPSSTSMNTSNSTVTSSSNRNSNNASSTGGTQTIVVEHHRDPIPVQQWQACWACGGMGTMGCDGCGGSGTKYIGDNLRRCGLCNGQGIRPCNICYGNKGQYITVYQ